jgi:hypothetical protein
MTDRMTPTVPELKRITELANECRQQLVADLAPEFSGREATPPWRSCSPPA